MNDIQLGSFPEDMNVAVIGATGGIGSAFVDHFANHEKVLNVLALSRRPPHHQNDKIKHIAIDITDEKSIQNAAVQSKLYGDLHMIIIATGILHHDTGLKPEKSLRDIDIDTFDTVFRINAYAPALIAKYFIPLLPRTGKSVFAALSAKVGSISDNGLGGWYAYRASKAALNMLIKNTAIETARRYKQAVILALHPGTVDTGLSAPFHANVPDHKLFSPQQSAAYLINVMNEASAEKSGRLMAWDGTEILP